MKMQKRNWIILIVVLVIILIGIYYRDIHIAALRDTPPNNEIITAYSHLSAADIQPNISEIDAEVGQYATSSRDIAGLSTEGGKQINYSDHVGNVRLIHQTFYGETFRSELDYYLLNKKVFFITIKRLEYEKPIDVDPEAKIQKVITRDFYLNEQKEVCSGYLDKTMQPIDEEMKKFVDFLISTLKVD